MPKATGDLTKANKDYIYEAKCLYAPKIKSEKVAPFS
jgi:hypothetical protein